jgi:hypothetical protein
LYWSYENGILVDDRTVNDDGLYGYEFFGGIGFNLVQFNKYHIGMEVFPSIVLWQAYTDEGFDNDVFGTLFMLKLRFTMSYLIKPKQD